MQTMFVNAAHATFTVLYVDPIVSKCPHPNMCLCLQVSCLSHQRFCVFPSKKARKSAFRDLNKLREPTDVRAVAVSAWWAFVAGTGKIWRSFLQALCLFGGHCLALNQRDNSVSNKAAGDQAASGCLAQWTSADLMCLLDFARKRTQAHD